MAFVVLHPGHVSKWKGRHAEFERDLKGHAKNRLPGFACPEWVQVVPELPVSFCLHRSSFGAVLKRRSENVDGKDTENGIAEECGKALDLLVRCQCVIDILEFNCLIHQTSMFSVT